MGLLDNVRGRDKILLEDFDYSNYAVPITPEQGTEMSAMIDAAVDQYAEIELRKVEDQ